MLGPVAGEPALLHGGTLVVADLHLGYGHELSDAGISLPSEFSEALDRIGKLAKRTGAKKIIFLGDVKHAVPSINPAEWAELPGFFSGLGSLKMVVVSGNHDGGIRRLVHPSVEVVDEFVERGVVFTHGNRWVSEKALGCRALVMAHMHPVVRLEDGMGRVYVEPVWIRGDVLAERFEEKYSKSCSLKKFIIMPAFSAYAGGNPVNRPHSQIGPCLRGGMLDFGNAGAYLLDGTFLGTVNDLKG